MSFPREKALTKDDLNFFIYNQNDELTDVNSIQYEIRHINDEDIEIITQEKTNATKFETGSYFADWEIPSNEPLGSHKIYWYWKLNSSSETQSDFEEFDVSSPTSGKKNKLNEIIETYVSVNEMMEEIQILDERPSKTKLLSVIYICQEYIEKITEQFFNKRYLTLELDGSGNGLLQFPIPIISISKISIKNRSSISNYPLSDFEIFNRFVPDDRNYPKIEFLTSGSYDIFSRSNDGGIFPKGNKNIQVTGYFGYTTPEFKTPEPIKMCLKMLVLMWFKGIEEGKKKLRSEKRFMDKGEKYEYRISESISSGTLTGDPEIDNILKLYMKAPSVSII